MLTLLEILSLTSVSKYFPIMQVVVGNPIPKKCEVCSFHIDLKSNTMIHQLVPNLHLSRSQTLHTIQKFLP